jgi:hypothetical protein
MQDYENCFQRAIALSMNYYKLRKNSSNLFTYKEEKNIFFSSNNYKKGLDPKNHNVNL